MILIVQSLWNEAITSKLADAAAKHLQSMKLQTKIVQVPGALEIALAIQNEHKKLKSKLKGDRLQ